MKNALFILTLLLFGTFFLVIQATTRAQQQPPITLNWVVEAGATKDLEIAQIMKQQLIQIGIDVEIQTFDEASFLARTYFTPGLTYAQGGFDVSYQGYSWMQTDYLWYIGCYSSNYLPPIGWNYWAWTDGTADTFINNAMTSYNTTYRLQNLYAWQEEHQKDVGTIVVGYPLYDQMTRADINGYNGMLRAYDAGNWTVANAAHPVTVKYLTYPSTGMVTGLLPFYPGTGYIELNTMYRSLYQVGLLPNGKYGAVPDMATSIDYSPDGLTATFHLRHDIMWHDGVPFTSKDVKYTFDADLDPKTEAEFYGDFSAAVSSVDAPDNYTVVLHLKSPTPDLATLVDNAYSLIAPEHVLGMIPDDQLKNSTYNLKTPPPGTGPFQFKDWTSAETVMEMTPFKGFYRGAPAIDNLVFEVVTEPMTGLSALESGGAQMLDLYFSVEFPDQITALKANDTALKIESVPYPRTLFIALNHNHPALNNRFVRQAIAYMVPYAQIRDTVYKGMIQLGNSPILPTTWGWDPNATQYTYDPAKAQQLMAMAGYSAWPPPAAVIPSSVYVVPAVGALVAGLIVGSGATYVLKKRGKEED